MQSYIDQRKVARYAMIGKILGFGGLGVMAIGLLISFRQPYDINLVFTLFLVGLVGSQIGMPLYNRWGRSPRFDEVLDNGLRGLDNRYAVFHYALGVDHALVTPAGVFALIPRLEDGQIEFADGEWRQTRAPRGLLRRGGTRKIRGLDRYVETEPGRLQRKLRRLTDAELPISVGAMVVFLHSEAMVDEKSAPVPAVHIKRFKGALRKLPKGGTLEGARIRQLAESLSLA